MNDFTTRAYDPDFVSGRLVEVVNALEEGFAVLDAEGRIQYANPAATRLFNVVSDDILGVKLLDFSWGFRGTDGTPVPREQHPSLLALAEARAFPARVFGLTLPSVDGVLWLEISARPLTGADGATVEGSVALFRDVGARRAAEQALKASQRRFEMLTSLIPVGIFQTDTQGACTYVNEAWTEISGMDAAAALGEGWRGALHPADRERVIQAWEAAARAGRPFREEHRYRRPDGEIRWVICAARANEAGEGEEGGFLGSVTDVTAQTTAAGMKDHLIGLVSHELRAPLVAIGGALGHLEAHAGSLDEQTRRLYDMAVRNTGFLRRLVSELLDIDRMEAGVPSLNIEAVGLFEVAQEAAEVVEVVGDGGGVKVRLDGIDPDLTVPADHDRLLQVFTNLLSNAAKFSQAGQAVTVSSRTGDDEVIVSVRDEGRGIAPELTERIFERFVQADPDTEGSRDGAGLGLTIARAIVQRHGGRLWVESTPGEGSVFSFSLPRTPPPA